LSAVPVLQALRNNDIVAMIGDRDFFNTGRPVTFLGRRRTMPTGPVLLAMLSGAALIPVFVLARPDGTYAGVLESPVPMDTDGDRTAAIDRNLARLARVFERYIRQHPDQWYCPDRLVPVDDQRI